MSVLTSQKIKKTVQYIQNYLANGGRNDLESICVNESNNVDDEAMQFIVNIRRTKGFRDSFNSLFHLDFTREHKTTRLVQLSGFTSTNGLEDFFVNTSAETEEEHRSAKRQKLHPPPPPPLLPQPAINAACVLCVDASTSTDDVIIEPESIGAKIPYGNYVDKSRTKSGIVTKATAFIARLIYPWFATKPSCTTAGTATHILFNKNHVPHFFYPYCVAIMYVHYVIINTYISTYGCNALFCVMMI